MATQVAGQEQEMQAQAQQFQQMQAQQSQNAKLTLMMRRRRLAQKLLAKAAFKRSRASEHSDMYFQFLFTFATVTDAADALDGIAGFIIMIFTFWVPLAIKALYVWGPRNYVWKGDYGLFLLWLGQLIIKWTPWMRALPSNSSNVMLHWLASIEHRDIDIATAIIYEVVAKRILKRMKSNK